ncbi:MAG: hypothetical protein METHSR3v1_1210028 [Methanothrix sp.]|nr:MAG: hypothetical protein METHSR3v1_1210028 [Methanothrix sp.]
MVNRYALTQPQRHRGTEAIFSDLTHPHYSAKSQPAQEVSFRSWIFLNE